jgi:chitodextrinase
MSARLQTRALRLVVLVVTLLILTPAAVSYAARDRTAPTTPSNLRITGSTATSVSLAWNPSTDNSGNWWYIVAGAGSIRVDPPNTTLTRAPLAQNRTFTFTVYAVDAAGNRSGNSNSVTFTTPPDSAAPSPAPALSVTAVYPTRVQLGWTGSKDDTSPQVFHTLFTDGVARDVSFRSSYLVQQLAPASTHTFRVTVRDQVGNTASSGTVTVTTAATTDTVPPSAPTDLRETTAGCEEAWLRWTASTDDTDPASLLRYDVYVNGIREPIESSSPIGSTATVAYARGPGLNTFVVRAVDTSGNVSAPSNAFTCTL